MVKYPTMDRLALKDFLDEKYTKFNTQDFIPDDPIQIPHQFSKQEDIEISGLFAAVIAWGNRKSIIKNAKSLMERMDHSPHDFIRNFTESDLQNFDGFVHRTFNQEDCATFCFALQNIYKKHNNLGNYFELAFKETPDQKEVLHHFKKDFFHNPYKERSLKHLPDPLKGSAAKRICMYFRWMVRKDEFDVDFGIWNNKVSTSLLHLPLDVHTSNVGRSLGLLTRKQNDWKAVEEITNNLKELDPNDPTKYDFSLFGLGVNEDF